MKEECEHKVVLEIYKGKPHTKENISHFRCTSCGKEDTKRFGKKIIYDRIMEKSPLLHYFGLCNEGKAGVMPYMEGQKNITFVWNNKWGFGREVKLGLTKKGRDEALKKYKELDGVWKKKRKK